MKTLFLFLIFFSTCPFARAQWEQTNGPGGGIINDIVSDGTTLYAATFGDGVYRSDNDGVSWKRINNGLSNLYMATLTISEDKIFAGSFREGIYLSTNKENTWVGINKGLDNLFIKAIAVSKSILFAGTVEGMFTSSDNGNIWTKVNAGFATLDVTSIIEKENTLFAGTEGGGVFINASLLTGTDDVIAPGRLFSFYPNPSCNIITIKVADISGDAYLSIFNTNGRKVLDYPITDVHTTTDISRLPSGMYFLRIMTDGLIQTQKLIKE